MSIIQHLKTKIPSADRSYACRFCDLSFEKPRTNCPACGCSDVE